MMFLCIFIPELDIAVKKEAIALSRVMASFLLKYNSLI
jgi:hypothetical protein